MTTTARAYPNIALIKYWGKADEELMLPAAGSLSMTLDIYPTVTSVRRNNNDADTMIFNGRPATDRELARAVRLLDVLREIATERGLPQAGTWHVDIATRNAAPTGAGMASSASGFAALAVAAAAEFGLELSPAELSRLARRGSGSAARSIVGGVALWHAGTDAQSYAEPVSAPEMRMISVVVSRKHKKITSREAMRITAATSPYYAGWVETTQEMLPAAVQACADGDFTRLGELAEMSALRMHAAIMACEPPIHYLEPVSWEIIALAGELRENGIPVYATADAGPNVVLITTPTYAEEVAQAAQNLGTVSISGPGPAAQVLPASASLFGGEGEKHE